MAAWRLADASKAELLICAATLVASILNPPKAGAFNKSSGGAHEDTSLRLSIFQVHNQNKTSQPGVARRSSVRSVGHSRGHSVTCPGQSGAAAHRENAGDGCSRRSAHGPGQEDGQVGQILA